MSGRRWNSRRRRRRAASLGDDEPCSGRSRLVPWPRWLACALLARGLRRHRRRQRRRRRAIAADLARLRRHRPASSRSGPTAAPTARRACCARAIASRGEIRATGEVLPDMAAAARIAPASTRPCCAPTSRARSPSARSRFFAGGHYQGDAHRAAAALSLVRRSAPHDRHEPTHAGRVVFVGAGPGQADLITLRGAQRLQARRRGPLRLARRPGAARARAATRAGSTSASAASPACRTRRAAAARTPARTRSTRCSSSTRATARASCA